MRFVCASCGSVAQSAGPCERDLHERVETEDMLLGADVGGYRVARVIGEGGMGRVYRAVMPSIGAEVAIKVLPQRFADEAEIVERFVQEARTANLVKHDGLVNVIGAGVLADGRPYQIMELLHGRPLARVLDGRRLAIGTACEVIREALRAIAVLHERGIIHRDLTPSNLFVTTGGRIKIIDFGIAKVLAARRLTETGQTVGTPRYMAPEQLGGEALDARADLYALSVVLFESVTGKRAVDVGDLPSTGIALLDQVIRTGLALDREQRYATANEMEAALALVVEGLPDDAFVPLAPPAQSEVPKTIGKYLVQAVLGRGGGGTVMLARDPDLGRRVAIKLLHAGHRGLLAEAQAMARVAHPNVVTVYEVGMDEDRVFLAMEYVEGTDLSRWLDLARRSWREIIALFVAAGRGLEAAHAAGLTHRDFKPANVVVGRDGRARVGDFGLAHAHDEPGSGGTPAYMAPEQRTANIADARSDQYAFCTSLWEALHGALPDEGEVTKREGSDDRVSTEVPPAVDGVLARGLDEDPAKRHASMTELLAALERLAGERASRRVYVGAGAGVVVATAIVAFAATREGEPTRPLDPTPDQPGLASVKAAGSPVEVLRALDRVAPTVRASEEARLLAADAAAAGLVVVLEQAAPVSALVLSPDGKRLAIATHDSVIVQPLDGGAATTLAWPGEPTRLAFDDQRVLALVRDGLVALPADGSAGKYVIRCSDAAGTLGALGSAALDYVACPSGTGIDVIDRRDPARLAHTLAGLPQVAFEGDRVLVRNPGEAVLHDLRTRDVIWRHAVAGDSLIAMIGDRLLIAAGRDLELAGIAAPHASDFELGGVVAASPTAFVAWSSAGQIGVWSTARRVLRFDHGTPISAIVVPPRRSNRLVLMQVHGIAIADLDTGRTLALPDEVSRLAVSADGSVIAIAAGTTARVWYPDLRAPAASQVPALSPGQLALSADLAARAWCDGRAVIIEGAEATRVELPATCEHVAFDRDGVLAIATDDQIVRAWRAGTLAEIGKAPARISALSAIDATHAAVLDRKRAWHHLGGSTMVTCPAPVVAMTGGLALSSGERHATLCDAAGTTVELASATEARWRVGRDGSVLRLADERVTMFGRDGTPRPLPGAERIVDMFGDAPGVRIAVVQRDRGILVLEVGRHEPILLARSRNPRALQISPDGARVAAIVDGQLQVWEVARPDSPRALGGFNPRALIRLEVGTEAVVAVGAATTIEPTARTGLAITRWSFATPAASEVEAWIARARTR